MAARRLRTVASLALFASIALMFVRSSPDLLSSGRILTNLNVDAFNPAYSPVADQPQARKELAGGIDGGDRFQTLLGVTGSGKTATMAFTIEKVQRPAGPDGWTSRSRQKAKRLRYGD